jgi:hypothetical protein
MDMRMGVRRFAMASIKVAIILGLVSLVFIVRTEAAEQTSKGSIISMLPPGSFRVHRADFHIDESRDAWVRFTFIYLRQTALNEATVRCQMFSRDGSLLDLRELIVHKKFIPHVLLQTADADFGYVDPRTFRTECTVADGD